MSPKMQRRDFITLLGGAAAAWPLAARAQQPERMRHIGVLNAQSEDTPDSRARVVTFREALRQAGWTDGGNVRIDFRWAAGDPAVTRKHAEELVALAPDAIVCAGAATVAPLLQATRSIPIVFVTVADPVGAGFVESMARPGGNATGFTAIEYGFGSKWLELLKEIAPQVRRVAVLRDPTISVGIGVFGAIQNAAPLIGVDAIPVNVRDPAEIERALATFAQKGNGGFVATPSALTFVHRDLIIALAARHKLPGVYQAREFAAAGGLAALGPDILDQFRRAAAYVDRILKGEKPADLPVQAPTKYELVVNLKTAKALGLEMPTSVLARADEVIE
jgi:putative tryptophan/tyrosine transport system substrate-binding protein